MASVPENGVRPSNPADRRVIVLPAEVPVPFSSLNRLFSGRGSWAGSRRAAHAGLSRRLVPRLITHQHGVHAPQEEFRVDVTPIFSALTRFSFGGIDDQERIATEHKAMYYENVFRYAFYLIGWDWVLPRPAYGFSHVEGFEQYNFDPQQSRYHPDVSWDDWDWITDP